ncbi:MAG: hypothetical protein WC374_07965 [Phycisphaerae bacterium]|jgi:hypothetical protein
MKRIRAKIFYIVIFSVTAFSCFARYGGGSGTAQSPYLIYTPAQMDLIGQNPDDWDCHFALMNDIDLGGYTGTQFHIIGENSTNAFTGVFDGRGHVILNFSYSNISRIAAGLFGVIGDGGVVKNLGLEEPNVSGFMKVGGLTGSVFGTVEECWVIGGTVDAYTVSAGGLTGDISGGALIDCYCVDTQVDSFGGGGLAGFNNGGFIVNSLAAAFVADESYCGSVVGEDSNGIYVGCFYDSGVNPTLSGIGDASDPAGLIDQTTANLIIADTFIDAGWDIVTSDYQPLKNTWRMCTDGVSYPSLAVEYSLADFSCPDGLDLYDLAVLADEWILPKLSADADFNRDRWVDFTDWAILAAAWKTTQADANYNPLADISLQWGDGIIDEYDAAAFAENWLKQGSAYFNADIEPYGGDGDVDFADFAAFADYWYAEF